MTYPPNPPGPQSQLPYGQPQYGQPQYGAPAPRGAASPEDLSLPLYGATFRQATRRFFKQYANFSGRASLSEYWWSALLTTIVMLVPTLLLTVGFVFVIIAASTTAVQDQMRSDTGSEIIPPVDLDLGAGAILLILGAVLLLVAWVALIVPSLSIAWRRLHDAGFPGPYYFLTLVPSVGSVIVLVLMLLPSKPEGQRFDRASQAPSRG